VTDASLDIVLPCLNEVAALPWILQRIPAGMRAIVVDNGSTDGSAEVARAYGALVIDCRQRGYGAACHAGALEATGEFLAFCDCDATIDPQVITAMAQLIRDGQAELAVGRRRPTTLRSWPLYARLANRELARRVRRRTGATLHDIGPVRVARRAPYLALGIADRGSGYPVETVIRAADAGWRIAEVGVAYLPREGRSKVTGTVRGTVSAVRDMSTAPSRPAPLGTVIVLAKQPLPGQAKTRLTPPLRPDQAAGVAAAALSDTLAAAARVDAGAHLLAFEGDPTEWLPTGWRADPQPKGGLDVRMIAAFAAVDQTIPAVLVGMDTPQFRPEQLTAFDTARYDACLGLATDGGYWAIGFADPGVAGTAIGGVPMSTDNTGSIQLARLYRAGLRVQLLDELSDFDTFDAACAIIDQAPHGAFAAAMRSLRAVR
jgi:glycosyltransferase A (GT-A) superfamily protein (DUF2064 family)